MLELVDLVWCFALWIFSMPVVKMNGENAKVTKKWMSLLHSIQILIHFLTFQMCWSLKRLRSHPPDIHGSSIFEACV